MMVAITTAMAFVSGGYAIHQITHSFLMTLPLVAIYGLSIFSMDRFIVSGRGSRLAWFRLPLAFLMGYIIAVPLELRLVEERIDQELTRQERTENHTAEDRRDKQRDGLQAQITKLEVRADEYRLQINHWGARMEAEVVGRVGVGNTGIGGYGPAYYAALEQKELNSNLLQQVSTELDRLRREQIDSYVRIDAEYERQRVPHARDLAARYEALHEIEQQHPEVAKLTWAISILLILIDIFPALTKLMLPYTAYAALIEAREREDIQRTHAIGNHNIREIVRNPANEQLFVIDQTAKVRAAAKKQRDIEDTRAS